MARIIKRNEIEVTCPKCGAVIAYTKADVKSHLSRGKEIPFVNCPACNSQIPLNDKDDPHDFDWI